MNEPQRSTNLLGQSTEGSGSGRIAGFANREPELHEFVPSINSLAAAGGS